MPVPDVIPIAYEPDYHTDKVGRHAQGQFLGGVVYGDIHIRQFRTEHDGILFGLVDESDDERGDHVELYPNGLGFHEPWDGSYDT